MAEFSAGAVMAMLGVVEATVIALYLHLAGKKADGEDVDDVEDTAEAAHSLARNVEDRADAAHRRLDQLEGGGRDA